MHIVDLLQAHSKPIYYTTNITMNFEYLHIYRCFIFESIDYKHRFLFESWMPEMPINPPQLSIMLLFINFEAQLW